MTSEEFWRDDPKLFSSYQKAYIEKTKREYDKINYSNWLQGLYIYDGFKKSLNDFSYNVWGKDNPNKETYPENPYDLQGKDKEKDKQALERKKVREKSQQNLNFWARIKK